MNEIQPYKEMSRIEDYDGDYYFTEASIDDLTKIVNSDKKFLKIGNELIAISSIKKISPHQSTGVETLPKNDREFLLQRISEYKKKFAEPPSQKQIDHWIDTEIKN